MTIYDVNFKGHVLREVIQITSLCKLNPKFYFGSCVVREGKRFFHHKFVLKFNCHFCDIPVDLNFALNQADVVLTGRCEKYNKYFDYFSPDELPYNGLLLVAEYNV